MAQVNRLQDGRLFDGGPLLTVQRSIGLRAASYPRILQSAILAVLIGWLPLLVLTTLGGTLLLPEQGFLFDFAVHARSLIAVPLLIFAEIICGQRLSAAVRHFDSAGFITEADRPRWSMAMRSTERLRDSAITDVIVIAAAYVLMVTIFYSTPVTTMPAWHWKGAFVIDSHSLAGWWHGFVSLPLLGALLLGWLWRLFLWGRFLWLMSRLDLKLVPAHPDRAGGLLFLAQSLQALSILALAISVIVAGTVANAVLHGGATLLSQRYTLLALFCINLALFCTPLFVFGEQLLKAKLRGIATYGALAGHVGQQFERKWFERKKTNYPEALEAPDFSATTDLYQIVANVYDMRLMPLTLRSFLPIVSATLVPFVPVVLMALPFSVILEEITSLMF